MRPRGFDVAAAGAHQERSSPQAQRRIGSFFGAECRSCVLNATGSKISSAARITAGSENNFPASLHPCQPGNSTKLAKIGFLDFSALRRASSRRSLPLSPAVRLV